jgi:Rtf2 RING-finger
MVQHMLEAAIVHHCNMCALTDRSSLFITKTLYCTINICQAEYGPFTASDIIKLAPDTDELLEMRKQMIAAREAVKAAKAAKKLSAKSDSSSSKRKAADATTGATTTVVVVSGNATDAVQSDERKSKKVCVCVCYCCCYSVCLVTW